MLLARLKYACAALICTKEYERAVGPDWQVYNKDAKLREHLTRFHRTYIYNFFLRAHKAKRICEVSAH